MSMEFPTGTWNFEVVSTASHASANSLDVDWGTIEFQTVGTDNEMQLIVQGQASGFRPVDWTSNDDAHGSITAKSLTPPPASLDFSVGTPPNTIVYSFQRINITRITWNGQPFHVAHLADATVSAAGAKPDHVFFSALPDVSGLQNPPLLTYTDNTDPKNPLFQIVVTPDGNGGTNVNVKPSQGWKVTIGPNWKQAPFSWPPHLDWTQQSDAGEQIEFRGTVTMRFDSTAEEAVYRFGGSYGKTPKRRPSDDGDWITSSGTVPIQVRKSYHA